MINNKNKFKVLVFLSLFAFNTYADNIKSSDICSKATVIAREAIKTGDNYDKYLAIEGLFFREPSIDTSVLFEAINTDTPFLARAAIASILSINNIRHSNKLFELAYQDEVIADYVIDGLQRFTTSNSDVYIKWYLSQQPNHRQAVRALKAIAISSNQSLGQYIKDNYKQFTDKKLVELYALYALNKLNISFPMLAQKVLELSNDNDVYIKEMAAVIFADLDAEHVNKRLRELSIDDDPRVSVTALISLTRHDIDSFGSKLSDILMENKLPDSEIAAGGFKRLSSSQVFSLIDKMDLNKIAIGVVIRMVESTASLKGGDARKIYQWALKQKNEDLLIQTLFAITTRRQENEVQLLEHFLQNKPTNIKNVASWGVLVSGC
jgi:hypothetical protein